MKVTSVRLDDEMARELDHLAAALDRPRAWLIEQAIANYIEEQAWQVRAIGEALDGYRGGRASVAPHDQVMERLAAKLRDDR